MTQQPSTNLSDRLWLITPGKDNPMQLILVERLDEAGNQRIGNPVG